MEEARRVVIERVATLDGLVTATLDRPDRLDALDLATHDDLDGTVRARADTT